MGFQLFLNKRHPIFGQTNLSWFSAPLEDSPFMEGMVSVQTVNFVTTQNLRIFGIQIMDNRFSGIKVNGILRIEIGGIIRVTGVILIIRVIMKWGVGGWSPLALENLRSPVAY